MSKARQLADLGNQVDDGAITGTNMVINGAMNVAQRSSSVTGITANGYHVCDRWTYNRDGTEVITMSQENDAPAGFYHSTKILVTTADTSLPAGTHQRFETRLEAQDVRQLAHGTADAKQATVSFWVKSNKTGDYSVGFFKDDEGGNNTISQGYTINSSGTWEYKTHTFAADTSNGFASTDANKGLRVWFTLGANSDRTTGTANTWSTSANHRAVGQSVNLFDAVNNYWQITGVCLNIGDSAIDFPHDESYGDTLARCQRYFQKITSGNLRFPVTRDNQSTTSAAMIGLPVGLRASPTVSGTSTKVASASGGALGSGPSNLRGWDANSPSQISIGASSGVTSTTGVAGMWFSTDIDAEL